jgi:hypothetical protein
MITDILSTQDIDPQITPVESRLSPGSLKADFNPDYIDFVINWASRAGADSRRLS